MTVFKIILQVSGNILETVGENDDYYRALIGSVVVFLNHHLVACSMMDVAVPTSVLHACRFCAR